VSLYIVVVVDAHIQTPVDIIVSAKQREEKAQKEQ
jgi:hypothetical protein